MVKIDIQSIKRLVVYGCSFTAGCELLDHTLEENFGELKKKVNIETWFQEISKNEKVFYQLMQNREKEKYLAWPGKLANELNLEIVSYAQCGNSNEKIIWQIENCFYKKIILETDLILVGLISPFRTMNFDDSNEEPIPFLLSNDSYIEQNFSKGLYNYFNNSRILWNYIRDLEYFLRVKEKLNGRLFLIHMESPFLVNPYHPWNLYDLGKQTDFFSEKVRELTVSDLFLSQTNYLYENCEGIDLLEHRHPKEHVHQRFAIKLSNFFKK